jgi:hypoxanthine phosphoribosyltransferase
MKVLDKEFELFIASDSIMKRTAELAFQLNEDYAGKDPVFVVLLNGAFMFATDLIKNIALPCQVCFIKATSYQGIQSTGVLKQLMGLEENIEARHVVLLDDIVDTGLTMRSVMDELWHKKPASIEPATLLLKPEAFGNQFHIKYVGFTIPNDFVVGYGLDYNGYGRNLKDLYHLKIA